MGGIGNASVIILVRGCRLQWQCKAYVVTRHYGTDNPATQHIICTRLSNGNNTLNNNLHMLNLLDIVGSAAIQHCVLCQIGLYNIYYYLAHC